MRLFWEVVRLGAIAGALCFAASAQEKSDQPAESPATKTSEKSPVAGKEKAPAKSDAAQGATKAKAPAKSTAAESEPAPPSEPPVTAEHFPQLRKEWEDLDTRLNELGKRFLEAPSSEEKSVIRTRYTKLVQESEKLLPKLRKAAEEAFAAAPNQDQEATAYMIKFVAYDWRRQEFGEALKRSRTLMDAGVDDPALFALAGASAIELGDYDDGQKWLSVAREAKKVDPATDARLTQRLKDWEQEQAIRAKEAEAGDLPRVKLETTKGTVVLELFENEAPQTVGNFISLVESKAYDDKSFHRVIPGFMAQGGDPKGDGTGGPGYSIYCECYREDHRKHFKGSLSMAHSGRDTGGSQFFITYRPTTHLDGKHTVFGRVIEGMDIVEQLQPRNPDDARAGKTLPTPDKIVKAEVVKKRHHEYQPTKVEKQAGPPGAKDKAQTKDEKKIP